MLCLSTSTHLKCFDGLSEGCCLRAETAQTLVVTSERASWSVFGFPAQSETHLRRLSTRLRWTLSCRREPSSVAWASFAHIPTVQRRELTRYVS